MQPFATPMDWNHSIRHQKHIITIKTIVMLMIMAFTLLLDGVTTFLSTFIFYNQCAKICLRHDQLVTVHAMTNLKSFTYSQLFNISLHQGSGVIRVQILKVLQLCNAHIVTYNGGIFTLPIINCIELTIFFLVSFSVNTILIRNIVQIYLKLISF